ncbi:MAG TPA: riboflavin synthase [Gaiellales bacterium]|jgi:riboflavin synthase|nr:riboflavin synthase [Gaiellales bacterium]
MFTGIVIEQGVVEHAPPQLVLRAPQVAADVAIGDSVAVDGCCLTVTAVDGPRLQFDAVPETLRRTTLGGFAPGSTVNLEPALRAGDRMGGHVVQGHVDGVGELVSAEPEGDAVNLTFAAPEPVLRYVIEKGSITVNGVSLTVTGFDEATFSVSIIPHTREVTNLGGLEPGDRVNLEADIFGKYVERLLVPSSSG